MHRPLRPAWRAQTQRLHNGVGTKRRLRCWQGLGVTYLASAVAKSLVSLANPGRLAADPPVVGFFLVAFVLYW